MTGRDGHFLHLGPEGFMRIGYREWGDPAHGRALVCVHGLSRNRKDFDELGEALADGWYVLALDMPGRGDSDWLADKEAYTGALYASVCSAAISRLGVDRVDWVGTSMGGRIGMDLAARRNSPIRRLVLNDIGPHVPAEGRRHNQASFGDDPRFASLEQAIEYTKVQRSAFGPMSEDGWRKMARDSLRPVEGGFALHYDPGLSMLQKREPVQSIETWTIWGCITCPVLTIWGTESKLLLKPDLEEMQRRGPQTEVLEVPGVGHAPPLTGARIIGGIRAFLEG